MYEMRNAVINVEDLLFALPSWTCMRWAYSSNTEGMGTVGEETIREEPCCRPVTIVLSWLSEDA